MPHGQSTGTHAGATTPLVVALFVAQFVVQCVTALIAPARAGDRDVPAPVTDAAYREVRAVEAKLGQLLFYDPILSGNRNIACATCHHPRFGTSDGVSLAIGEGGIGLGPERAAAREDNPPERRLPRNSPALFNLGALEFRVLFHDGRVETDSTRESGMRTPLGADMPAGFSGVLSVQTMFPVVSPDEMAGHYNENDVSRLVSTGRITGPTGAWQRLAERVSGIDEYAQRFAVAYPDIGAGRAIEFADVSNAIAAFIAFEWRSDDSPFDRYVRGEAGLPPRAREGMHLFYGRAGCSRCHSGPFQTDHAFHAMGVPQLGPGKAARFESHARDTGRARVTGRTNDAYRFRTPSLRNVSLTAPYGHSGAYRTLEHFVESHLDPARAIGDYDRARALLPPMPPMQVTDWWALDDVQESNAIAGAVETAALSLNAAERVALLTFLESLTEPAASRGRLGIPDTVPSGLPVDR